MANILETIIPVRVGYTGTKVHRLRVSVRWSAQRGEAGLYTGQTHCGSQRFASGWSPLPLGTAVTCERCLAGPVATERRTSSDGGWTTEPDWTRVVREERRRVVPTEEAAAFVTPGPEEACESRTLDWTTRTEHFCRRTGAHGAEHDYDPVGRSLDRPRG